jgi:hypothetical protein
MRLAFGEFSAFSKIGGTIVQRVLNPVNAKDDDAFDKPYKFPTSGRSASPKNAVDGGAQSCYVSLTRARGMHEDWLVFYLDSSMAIDSLKFENGYFPDERETLGTEQRQLKTSPSYEEWKAQKQAEEGWHHWYPNGLLKKMWKDQKNVDRATIEAADGKDGYFCGEKYDDAGAAYIHIHYALYTSLIR